MNELKLKIARIALSITSPDKSIEFKVNDNYLPFIAEGQPDAVLQVHYGSLPKFKLEEEIFNSGTIWSLYRSKGKYILKVPPRIAVLDSDFRSGDIYIEPSSPSLSYSYPLDYPLDEVLMINWLSRGLGIMMHACGVKHNGQGIIFAGTSGAGKSTIADLWKNRISRLKSRRMEPSKNTILLSDDRIIIRKIDGRFFVFGTPWHGDSEVCSPEEAPLDKIFFLQQARENKVKKIDSIKAVARLIVCSFPPFWDKKGMEFTLNYCTELAQRIPCYELDFVPDKRVLDLVRSI
jgi:hypothetical protein